MCAPSSSLTNSNREITSYRLCWVYKCHVALNCITGKLTVMLAFWSLSIAFPNDPWYSCCLLSHSVLSCDNNTLWIYSFVPVYYKWHVTQELIALQTLIETYKVCMYMVKVWMVVCISKFVFNHLNCLCCTCCRFRENL